jgi:hypothetical protein
MNMIQPFFRYWGLSLVLILALFIGFAAHTTFQSVGVRGTDDNLMFYMSGLSLFHDEALDQLNDRAITFFEQKGADPHAMMRLRLHKVGLNEYVLPGAIMYGVSRVLKTLFGPLPVLYPLFISQSIVFGFFLTFVLTVLALLGIFLFIKRPLFIWAIGLTLGLYGLSELLPLSANDFATILVHKNFGGILAHIRDLILHPASQFSPLAFTPRSNFALLLIGLFALRWSKHIPAAYGLLFILSFYHLSASGLILVMLVGIDAVVRPRIFRSLPVAGTLVLTTVLFLFRENMWEHLMGSELNLLINAAAIFFAIGIILLFPVNRQKIFGPHSFYARVQNALFNRGVVAADLTLIAVAWVVSLIVIYIYIKQMDLKLFADWSEVFYFWGRVNGRIMTLLFPSFVFGFFLLLLGLMARRNFFRFRRIGHVAVPVIVGVMAMIVIGHSYTIVEKYKVLPSVAQGYFKAENALRQGPMPQLEAMGFSEALLYYGFSKSVDGHPRQLNAILP